MSSPPGRTPDVAALTKVASADVFKKGRLAARLIRDKGTVRFEYDPQYLAGGGPAVATTLPLTEEPVVTARGAVPTYFAGLLPEGRRLSGLRRAVKTSADDDLTLLLAVGLDPVGDVQIVPAGLHPTPAEPLIQVDRAFEEVTFSEILHAGGVIDPVALAGVQDKASARMISVPVGKADKRYILKVDPPEFPHVWRTRPTSSGAQPSPTSRWSARAPSTTEQGAPVCWWSGSIARSARTASPSPWRSRMAPRS